MASEPSTWQWILSLTEPGQILTWAMSYYIKANLSAVFQQGRILAPILQANTLRDEAFGRFWVAFSSNRADPQDTSSISSPSPNPTPRITCSSDLIPPVLAHATGTVLDVGPGTGTQMPLLRSPSITRIYGPEPCTGLHAELRARADTNGLADKYTILPCSVVGSELLPALQKESLVDASGKVNKEGIFDTIICVRVLCSVPDLNRTAKELHGLLKPGGKLLIAEHVVNPWRTAKGSLVARVMQAVYGALGWSWCMGGCCLDRDVEGALRRAGEWEDFDVERWFGRSAMPYTAGVLVKR